MADRRRDPEDDIPCADCGREPARLRTVTRDGVRRLVCDPECPGTPTPRGDRLMARRVKVASDPALAAELREIEADWKAAREARLSGFRVEWGAAMASRPEPKPVHVAKFKPNRL